MLALLSANSLFITITPAGAVRLLLIIAVLLVYWPVTDHEFINFDDPDYITENRHVRSGITPSNVIWAFTTTYAGNWHPLTWLSHMLDVELFGMDPGGHHLVSLLFHLANTLLLFTVFRKMTGNPWQSGAVAALFAFHPLHVESVAWAAERKDVLSTFFGLLTMWSYARYAKRPAVGRYLPVFTFFVLGLMAKPMLVTLPFVLLLMDVWPLGRFKLETGRRWWQIPAAVRLVTEKAPLFLLSGVSAVITMMAQQKVGAVGPLSVYTLGHRVGNALVAYVCYIFKALWPFQLGVFYPHPGMRPGWQIGGAAFFLISASVLIIRAAKTRPYLGVGWFWYLGTLVPVIGLVQVGAQAMADRYTYIPLIGLFIIAAWGIPELTARWRYQKVVVGIVAVAVLLVWIPATRVQLAFWENDIRLYEHTLAITENNYIILNDLGLALAGRGRTDEAIGLYEKALRIEPVFEEARNNLGNAWMEKGRPDQAAVHYREALRINPDFDLARFNLGLALEKQRQIDAAVAVYRQALQHNPESAMARNRLGNLLMKQGEFKKALDYFRAAVRIDPRDGESHYNLAVALEKLGNSEAAVQSYRDALRAAPDLKQAHNNLGGILLKQGKVWEAAQHYHEALRIDPLFGEAQYNMGVALQKLGRLKEAAVYYWEALQIDPDFIQAHINLGGIFLRLGKVDPAIWHFKKALRLDPANVIAQKNLETALDVLKKR